MVRLKLFFFTLLTVIALSAVASAVSVTVSSPTNGATVTSPMRLTASATSSYSITGWWVYLDGKGIYNAGAVSGGTVSLQVPSGQHTLLVKVWDSSGASASKSLSINVTGGSTSVSVGVSPTSATVQTTQTRQFAATVSGTSNTAVNWLVNGVQGGNSTVGTISSSGLYQAPAAPPSGGSVTVTARSAYDSTKSANATVSVTQPATPVSVSISPTSTSLQTSQTWQFTASVSGTSSTSVNWGVNGIAGGNSTIGTVSSSGLYTAPSSVPSGGSVTVTATSTADSTKAASASVAISSGSASTGPQYYVSPSGNDSNSGSQSSPWATIQRAANAATAGTTVHVAPGTYYITSALKTANSGTATQPITFVSDAKWGAKIMANATIDSCWVNTGNYVTIKGFDLTETSAGSCRIGILNYASYVKILSNRVHDLTKASAIVNCDGNAGAAGIDTYSSTATDADIIGNFVGRIGNASNHSCVYIQGIYTAMKNVRIKNNIVYQAMSFGINMGTGSSTNTITNNTVFASGYGGMFVDGLNAVINNNIVYNNNVVGIDYQYSPAATLVNNLVYGQTSNWSTNSSNPHTGDVVSSPQFVNYMPDGTGNYQLSASSPAIDKATSQGAPGTDFSGGARPLGNGYDIGAYEYGSSPAAWPF